MPSSTITTSTITFSRHSTVDAAAQTEAHSWARKLKSVWKVVVASARHWMNQDRCKSNGASTPDLLKPTSGLQGIGHLSAHVLRDIHAPEWIHHAQAQERAASSYELMRAQAQARRFF